MHVVAVDPLGILISVSSLYGKRNWLETFTYNKSVAVLNYPSLVLTTYIVRTRFNIYIVNPALLAVRVNSRDQIRTIKL
jgi:hypothetical protein